MPVVNYDGKNTQTFRCDSGLKYRFLPGANEVPPATWEELKENEAVQNFIMRRRLNLVIVKKAGPPTEPKGPGKLKKVGGAEEEKELSTLGEADVGKMDAWTAVALVEGVIDLAHLNRFLEQEKGRKGGERKTVMAALTTQIAAMEATEPESKE